MTDNLDFLREFLKYDEKTREQYKTNFYNDVLHYYLTKFSNEEHDVLFRMQIERQGVSFNPFDSFYFRQCKLKSVWRDFYKESAEYTYDNPAETDKPLIHTIKLAETVILRQMLIVGLERLKKEYSSQDLEQDESRLKLDASLSDLLMDFLLAHRLKFQVDDHKHVDEQLSLLQTWFSHEEFPIDEVVWLNQTFTAFDENCSDNYCLTLSEYCVEQIKNPPQNVALNKASLRKKASNPLLPYSSRFAAMTLLDAIATTVNHDRNARQLGGWVQHLAPLATTGYTAFIFGPELLLAAGVTAALKVPSFMFKGSTNGVLDFIGRHCDELSGIVFYSTSALLLETYAMSVRAINIATLPFSSALCFLTGKSDDAIFSSKGIHNLAINEILRPITDYCEETSQQVFVTWRQGFWKTGELLSIVNKIEDIDKKDDEPLTKRLNEIKEIIDSGLSSSSINGSGHKAVAALLKALAEVERAQKAILSPDEWRFYDAYRQIIEPMRTYIKKQSLQAASGWRTGATKATVFKTFIDTCNKNLLDNDSLSADQKFKELEAELELLEDNDLFEQGSKSYEVIEDAQTTLNQFQNSVEIQFD